MIELERYKKGLVGEIIALLNAADADLLDQLAIRLNKIKDRGYDTGKATTNRLEFLIAEIRKLRQNAFIVVNDKMIEDMIEFSDHEMLVAKQSIESSVLAMGGELNLLKPSVNQLRAIVTAKPFQGRLMSDWFESLAQQSALKLSDAIKIGIAEQQTNDQIIRRIRGTRANRYEDGILANTRRETEAIVRTAVNHVSNQAAEQLYAANTDVIKGVQWVATLDSRTTLICASRDGHIYKNNEGPRPPAHWNCRSRTIPFLGETSIKGTRTSVTGAVPEDTTYSKWLRGQSKAVQEEVLGVARAKDFRAGSFDLDKFVDKSGKTYTLKELKLREAR